MSASSSSCFQGWRGVAPLPDFEDFGRALGDEVVGPMSGVRWMCCSGVSCLLELSGFRLFWPPNPLPVSCPLGPGLLKFGKPLGGVVLRLSFLKLGDSVPGWLLGVRA